MGHLPSDILPPDTPLKAAIHGPILRAVASARRVGPTLQAVRYVPAAREPSGWPISDAHHTSLTYPSSLESADGPSGQATRRPVGSTRVALYGLQLRALEREKDFLTLILT